MNGSTKDQDIEQFLREEGVFPHEIPGLGGMYTISPEGSRKWSREEMAELIPKQIQSDRELEAAMIAAGRDPNNLRDRLDWIWEHKPTAGISNRPDDDP